MRSPMIKEGEDYVLKLIDYDSMFIPSFREKDSLSTGTSSFQHPMRLTSDFSETIDRFSFWVFLTALEAFKTDALLWKNAGEYGYDKQKFGTGIICRRYPSLPSAETLHPFKY